MELHCTLKTKKTSIQNIRRYHRNANDRFGTIQHLHYIKEKSAFSMPTITPINKGKSDYLLN